MGRIDFGYILRRLRHDRNETLEQVSEATGISVAMLSRIERGERLPSPDSVDVLAKHFGLSADYLMSETIARRLVNRYGEEKSSRAAEHITREPIDMALIAPEDDEDDGPLRSALTEMDGPADDQRHPAGRRPRRYGPFRERDVLAALGAMAEPAEEPGPTAPAPAERRVASSDSSTDMRRDVDLRLFAQDPQALRSAGVMRRHDPRDRPTESGIDPATEQVLRAAAQASEAAALLVRREASSLSVEARLQLIDRVAALAGQTVDVLTMLAHDPDERVRDRGARALRRLARL